MKAYCESMKHQNLISDNFSCMTTVHNTIEKLFHKQCSSTAWNMINITMKLIKEIKL